MVDISLLVVGGLAERASRGDGKEAAFPDPSPHLSRTLSWVLADGGPGKAAGSTEDHAAGMSFDNAFFTPTFYVITAEHELRVRNAQRGSAPRRGRKRRRST
jgi:hypothetical protein